MTGDGARKATNCVPGSGTRPNRIPSHRERDAERDVGAAAELPPR